MVESDSMRVTGLWEQDANTNLRQKVGVMYHVRADEGVASRLEKALTLIKQRKELCKQHGLKTTYEAKLQILTDNGGNRGAVCLKVFLPEIPESLLLSQDSEEEEDSFDGLTSLFG
tara:strand:+ start:191 stop:538 length:348 start_codon:yes stop_codon:yes gene_type:complete